MKKTLRKISRSILNKLPYSAKEKLIRSSIKIPRELSRNMTFKIANTGKELEEAYKVLHDSYVEQTFITPTETGMRILSQHVLPTTTTIVGKIDDQVVGTLSIVKSGVLGLPLDKVFDVSSFKAEDQTYAEISALAVKKEFRREYGGQIFFPLLKYMYNYCDEFFHVDNLLIVIHPKDEVFYTGLMFFKRIPNTDVIDYMGAPAVALCLNLKYALKMFKEYYNGKSDERDLYTFFVKKKFSQFQFPKRDLLVTNDPIITKELFRDFFINRGKLFESISLKDFLILKQYFNDSTIAAVFSNYQSSKDDSQSFHNYSVKMKGSISETQNDLVIFEISKTEVKVRAFYQFEKEVMYNLTMAINHTQMISVKAKVNSHNRNTFSFSILEENVEWNQLITQLEHIHHYKAKNPAKA